MFCTGLLNTFPVNNPLFSPISLSMLLSLHRSVKYLKTPSTEKDAFSTFVSPLLTPPGTPSQPTSAPHPPTSSPLISCTHPASTPLLPLPSCNHGSYPDHGLRQALVDGGDGHHREPTLLGCAAGLGLPAHHAQVRGLLLLHVHRGR